jgi:hypothetical protein
MEEGVPASIGTIHSREATVARPPDVEVNRA